MSVDDARENSKMRQTFLEYKEQNAKTLRDALIVPAVAVSSTGSTSKSIPKSLTNSLIVPLINIVSEYWLSLPNCDNTGGGDKEACDDDCKSRNYYFSSWQELIAHFPDFVQWSIDQDGNGGMVKLASIVYDMGASSLKFETKTEFIPGSATKMRDLINSTDEQKNNDNIVNTSSVIGTNNVADADRICELVVYHLLGLEHSDYDRHILCKRYLRQHFSHSLRQICDGITRPYNLDSDVSRTFWENFIPILWTRPGTEWTDGSSKSDKVLLQMRKQIAIRCIRDYHKFRNSRHSSHNSANNGDVTFKTSDCKANNIDAANEQLILLVEHLLN